MIIVERIYIIVSCEYQIDVWFGFSQMTGLEDHDIVFVRYVGAALDHKCLPYFIAVDRSTESIGRLTTAKTL